MYAVDYVARQDPAEAFPGEPGLEIHFSEGMSLPDGFEVTLELQTTLTGPVKKHAVGFHEGAPPYGSRHIIVIVQENKAALDFVFTGSAEWLDTEAEVFVFVYFGILVIFI